MLVCIPGMPMSTVCTCSAAIKAGVYLYAYIPISAQSSCTVAVCIRFKLDLICKRYYRSYKALVNASSTARDLTLRHVKLFRGMLSNPSSLFKGSGT